MHGPNEFIITRPSAPASSTALAIVWISVCGLIFINTGQSKADLAAFKAFTIGATSVPT